MATSLLEGKALTWWRTECAASLNLLSTLEFDDLAVNIEQAFLDVDHVHRLRSKLNTLR